jgi:signal transduction histidine kinase
MKKLIPKLWARITALVLLCVFAAAFAASCFGILFLLENDAYSGKTDTLRDTLLDQDYENDMETARNYAQTALGAQTNASKTDLSTFESLFSRENSNFYFQVKDDKTGKLLFESPNQADAHLYSTSEHVNLPVESWKTTSTLTFSSTEEFNTYVNSQNTQYSTAVGEVLSQAENGSVTASVTVYQFADTNVVLTGYLRSPLTVKDKYYTLNNMAEWLFRWRWNFIAIAAASFAVCLFLFIFLLCAAGHKEGVEGVHLSWFDRIPLDLYLLFLLLLCAAGLNAFPDFSYLFSGTNTVYAAVVLSLACVLCVLLAMSVFMTFAARAKAGGWWKNTVVYKVLVLLGRFFRWLGRGIRYVFRNLPLCWKGALVWCGLCLVELIFMAACSGDTGRFAAWWLLGRIILTAAVVLTLIALRKLQKGGEALAKGDLRYQIDLRHLYGDLKAHGENLNSIAGGMQKAVDEQLRAERFKTELITNVSHDIKTPLTSIVNYVDLMKKEDLQPEKAKEYLAVLDRQSARLKKLTEDLVEASKASTGAMPVALGRTDLNVLLSQVAGEYDDRLRAAGLEPVLTLCPAMPAVLADGKLLWRVFDNLLGNICKYALPGTRVYLETRAESGKAVVSFKNVSKYALNISSSELMERFVRGDSSRSTEGSGLGLSIAQSLTQLQGGEFQLVIDGDLFKALVSFGALPPETT